MAKHLSAVRREPHFISFPHACRESTRGTCHIRGWKNSAESHVGFHASNLCFPTYLLWQFETPERQKAKSERKLQAYPYCGVSLSYLRLYLCLAVLADFQTTICQKVLIFTINILIYSFILSFPFFFLSLSYYTALMLSQRCWGAMVLEEAPSPLTDSRMWYSNDHSPSVSGDASTASLYRGGISL